MAGLDSFEIPYAVRRINPGPIDWLYTPFGGPSGYDDAAQVVRLIPRVLRYDGLRVKLKLGGEMWWEEFTGLEDGDLKLYAAGGGGGGAAVTGFSFDDNQLTIATSDGPFQVDISTFEKPIAVRDTTTGANAFTGSFVAPNVADNVFLTVGQEIGTNGGSTLIGYSKEGGVPSAFMTVYGLPAKTFKILGSSGYVGFGTSAPSQRLHVEEGVAQIRAGSGASGQTPAVTVENTVGKATSLYAGSAYSGINFSDDGYFIIGSQNRNDFRTNQVAGGSASTPIITIRPAGNVGFNFDMNGIGRISSEAPDTDQLFVQSKRYNGYSSIGFLNYQDQSVGGFGYGNPGVGILGEHVYFYTRAKPMLFSVDGGANSAIYIDASANIGIGTKSPDAKLKVEGTIKAAQSVTADGYNLPDRTFIVYDANQQIVRIGDEGTATLRAIGSCAYAFTWYSPTTYKQMALDGNANLTVDGIVKAKSFTSNLLQAANNTSLLNYDGTRITLGAYGNVESIGNVATRFSWVNAGSGTQTMYHGVGGELNVTGPVTAPSFIGSARQLTDFPVKPDLSSMSETAMPSVAAVYYAIVNNLDFTNTRTSGFMLDARQGPVIKALVADVDSRKATIVFIKDPSLIFTAEKNQYYVLGDIMYRRTGSTGIVQAYDVYEGAVGWDYVLGVRIGDGFNVYGSHELNNDSRWVKFSKTAQNGTQRAIKGQIWYVDGKAYRYINPGAPGNGLSTPIDNIGDFADTAKWENIIYPTTFTPQTIKDAVTASSNTWTNGELQGPKPGNSLPRMKFSDATYVYEYMNGMNDTDGTTYVWVRILKSVPSPQ